MLAAGTQLAGYRIEGFLGRGGMGVVYEATQLSLQRPVALNLLASIHRLSRRSAGVSGWVCWVGPVEVVVGAW